MDLIAKNITKKSKDYKEIISLYKTAFPKYEQNPIWLLNKWAKKDCINFTAYYDNEIFCGFTYTSQINNNIFVLYLAVTDKIRSKGYGSKILNTIKNNNPNSVIYLNIETLDKNAENYEQRVSRYNFYRKNGFESTGKLIKIGADNFLILSTSTFDEQAYVNLLKIYHKKYNPIITNL